MPNMRLMLLAGTETETDLERILDAYENARRRRQEERRRRGERATKVVEDGDEESTEQRSKTAGGSTCVSGCRLADLLGDAL